jgi:copper chaperone CopZ
VPAHVSNLNGTNQFWWENLAMQATRLCVLSLLTLFLIPQICHAGTVTVKGVHMCCGGCKSLAETALADLTGVDKVVCDLNTKAIEFKAADEKAVARGIKALAEAGFYGKANHDKKTLAFPKSGAKKGLKSNVVLLSGVHLCCTACVSASHKALLKVRGVTVIDIDRNAKSIKLTGDAMDTMEVVEALNRAGFFGQIGKKSSPTPGKGKRKGA